VVDVAEAQARYAPAVPPARPRAATLDATALTARIQDDAARVADWRSQFASTHYGDAQKAPVSAAGLIQVAHVYFLAGKLDAARLTLEDVLRRSPRSASALNDLAGLDLVAGDARRAVERCEAALAIDPDDPGVRLNYALAHQAAGDNVAAERALAEAVARSGGADRAWELLGVRPGDVAQKAGDVPSTLIDAARGPAPRFYWKP
jgi:predicted Zn-dependent protease